MMWSSALPAPGLTLTHVRTGAVVAHDVELALTRTARRKGLLARDELAPGAALILAPCFAVHTAFMRFPIDVLFVDRAGCVRRIVRRMTPWRMAASLRAYATIELSAGALDRLDIAVGDRVAVGPGGPRGKPSPSAAIAARD